MKVITRKFIMPDHNNFMDSSNSIFNQFTMNVTQSLLSKNSGIGVTTSYDETDKYPQENLYIILDGKVEFVIEDTSYILQKNETIMVSGYGSFAIWGKEESTLLCITMNDNNLHDNLNELAYLISKEEEHDSYTKNHNARVGRISGKIYQSMFPGKDITTIVTAGSFHDIGKSKIPSNILNKNGKLTEEEYKIIQNHPIYTKEILEDVFDSFTCKIAYEHHEMLDGSGYPQHLKGEELCIESRILAVADIFDALTSKRSYRDRMNLDEALTIIEEMVQKGKLDGIVVKTLVHLIEHSILSYDSTQEGIC